MILDKVRIKQSFSAASLTYDSVAGLQRTVGRELLHAIDATKLTDTLLDLGCGTGFLTGELLVHSNYETVIALDIALSMLQTTQGKLSDKYRVNYICADAEHLPLAEKSIDGVYSNLALQWCRNLEVVFTDIKRVLKPEGQLVFSTFGPQTLQELKSAWATVDNYNHVNTFYSEAQLKLFLQQAGFKNSQFKSKLYISPYDSVWMLMQELKCLGAQHVIAGRNKKITTKTAMQQMILAYEKYKVSGQISATFEVISVIAKV
ncbi:malonyl-ACP O-methyltransferase BioC [Methylobacter sp. S3L5C]|uniref:malonyl-ACP O-methyltransferase BioC n=1 Tax=Methylobacter sp. S3L5C TaxID=2839024 RepID=UPI001FAD5684|nr:malonyl-ACP O-methyltransferase BioC [Methylobacter sp. S3L5C]UOA07921.1 malonyl-ACP O-methyltransferase BioC [Methylobacter sp. S3L5C]